ncbi:ABC transporter substrate-binding protein [Novosphingobium colocasiae]|uniref:ABC transporter substrate-binding protein n=1 Tax=Novosphingobium colocasiae TaxID=1256513 RepID=UPI0035AF8EDA
MSRGWIVGALALASGCGAAPHRDVGLETREHAFTYPRASYVETEPGRPGGTLRISVASDTGTLDLQTIAATNPKWLGRLMFDNLVYLDDKGNITPWLARSWDISPDGRTYTFHLRHDVTFSDGTAFDAEAVRANLDRVRDPKTRAAMTTAYIAPYVAGRVIDRYTFEARLSEPYTPFLNVLAQSWLGMLSPATLRRSPAEIASHPVGSGPYVVESYRRQEGIVFAKRRDYAWAPDFLRHKGPAYIDRIEVGFVPEALIRYVSLASGQYQLTIDAPPQNARDIRANPELVLGNRINLGNPTRAITFNISQAPFDETAVRQAFALAIDRAGIARMSGFGEFTPTRAFLSANTPFADLGAVAGGPDLSQAALLLDGAGWTGRDAAGYRTRGGKRLEATVLLTEAAMLSPIVVALQSDVRRIGFKLNIEQVTLPQLTERRRRNDYQALGPGYWHTNTPDGLFIVYHGKQISTPAFIGQNTTMLHDPQLDALLSQAREARDPAQLARLYANAQARLVKLMPAVPLYENHTLIAYRRSLRGLVYDTSHNMPFLTTAWLAESSS